MEGLILANRILGFVNAPALMQRAVTAARCGVDLSLYERNRGVLYQALVEAGYAVTLPEGAFYMFPRSPIEDDVASLGNCSIARCLWCRESASGRRVISGWHIARAGRRRWGLTRVAGVGSEPPRAALLAVRPSIREFDFSSPRA